MIKNNAIRMFELLLITAQTFCCKNTKIINPIKSHQTKSNKICRLSFMYITLEVTPNIFIIPLHPTIQSRKTASTHRWPPTIN